MHETMEVDCPECDGTGRHDGDKCAECYGEGTITVAKPPPKVVVNVSNVGGPGGKSVFGRDGEDGSSG